MSDKTVFIVSMDTESVEWGVRRAGRHPDVRDTENGVNVTVRGEPSDSDDEFASWLCYELAHQTRRGR